MSVESTANSQASEVAASQPAQEQSVQTQSTQQPVAQSSDSQTSAPGATDGTAAVAQAVASQQAWQPNFKFKFMDQEKEFDDWAKKVLNQENEKSIRELYEKAHGLDFVKQRFHKTRDELNLTKKEFEELRTTWNELSGMYQRGDLNSFFGALKIPDEKIFEYVQARLNYMNAPQEQRMAMDQQNELQRRAYLLEKQNQELQQRYEQEAIQARNHTLESELSKPDVTSIAQAYDARVGQGAFRELVIERGVTAYHMTGKDITPAEAVAQALRIVGHVSAQPQQQSAMAAMQQAPMQQQQQVAAAPVAKEVPVIPNVGSRNTSPAKKAPRTLDDIKKLAEQFSA
jgi:hypothetical protein